MTTEIKHKSFFMKQTIKVLSICLLALSIISCSDDPKVFGNTGDDKVDCLKSPSHVSCPIPPTPPTKPPVYPPVEPPVGPNKCDVQLTPEYYGVRSATTKQIIGEQKCPVKTANGYLSVWDLPFCVCKDDQGYASRHGRYSGAEDYLFVRPSHNTNQLSGNDVASIRVNAQVKNLPSAYSGKNLELGIFIPAHNRFLVKTVAMHANPVGQERNVSVVFSSAELSGLNLTNYELVIRAQQALFSQDSLEVDYLSGVMTMKSCGTVTPPTYPPVTPPTPPTPPTYPPVTPPTYPPVTPPTYPPVNPPVVNPPGDECVDNKSCFRTSCIQKGGHYEDLSLHVWGGDVRGTRKRTDDETINLPSGGQWHMRGFTTRGYHAYGQNRCQTKENFFVSFPQYGYMGPTSWDFTADPNRTYTWNERSDNCNLEFANKIHRSDDMGTFALQGYNGGQLTLRLNSLNAERQVSHPYAGTTNVPEPQSGHLDAACFYKLQN